jgi:hypothetical protein
MQVEREKLPSGSGSSGERVSNTWATYLQAWDNFGKPELIPDNLFLRMKEKGKVFLSLVDGPAAH